MKLWAFKAVVVVLATSIKHTITQQVCLLLYLSLMVLLQGLVPEGYSAEAPSDEEVKEVKLGKSSRGWHIIRLYNETTEKRK